MDNENRYTIWPYKTHIIILIICFLGSVFLALMGAEGSSRALDPKLLSFIIFIGLILRSKSYVLTDNGFTEHILWLKRRSISWDDVGEILFFESSYKLKNTMDSVFIITARSCDKFDPNKENIHEFVKRHKRFVTIIPTYKKQAQDYIVLFEKTFGPLVKYK